ncbi:LysE family translocator [Neisseria sp. N95_16]|uniref:LysE family translocator n=1 Tax=Neisseria brasiliensis TaxID=2666100 RepID=A0A7X2KZU3_9NEIS|nr:MULTISPECIES: LysE family translocator [Neisseria]MRN38640.1 hypothetical protein [Neisseria brasiliensis]PJO08699.1 LysE family translocator [Neisseria sp. N95_16]
MNATQTVYFLLSSMLVAALPGPAMMLVIQGAIHSGWRKGASITAGILLADALLLVAVCLGVGGIIASSESMLTVMNVFSSCYLIYLAYGSFRAISSLRSGLPVSVKNVDWKAGFWITIINPKTIIFLIAYLPRFIDHHSDASENIQLFMLSFWFVIAVAVVMSVYALAAHGARRFLEKIIVRQTMEAVFGMVLLFIGLHGLWEMVSTR